MKKIIILSLVFSLLGASVALGASKIKDIMSYDFIAHIQTEDSKDVKIYKLEDAGNSCYITYFSGWTNGNQIGISCVNTIVKK